MEREACSSEMGAVRGWPDGLTTRADAGIFGSGDIDVSYLIAEILIIVVAPRWGRTRDPPPTEPSPPLYISAFLFEPVPETLAPSVLLSLSKEEED